MKFVGNLIVGTTGTGLAITLPEFAATLAGFSTAAWMLTQAYLALRARTCVVKDCPRRRLK